MVYMAAYMSSIAALHFNILGCPNYNSWSISYKSVLYLPKTVRIFLTQQILPNRRSLGKIEIIKEIIFDRLKNFGCFGK